MEDHSARQEPPTPVAMALIRNNTVVDDVMASFPTRLELKLARAELLQVFHMYGCPQVVIKRPGSDGNDPGAGQSKNLPSTGGLR